MAMYRGEAIMAELFGLREQVWSSLMQPERRSLGRGNESGDLAAAVHFVKRLAMKAKDVRLLGEAEFLRMEMADTRDLGPGGGHPYEAYRAAKGRQPSLEELQAHSSEEMMGVLQALANEGYPGGGGDADEIFFDDWRAQAAEFVKRLAAVEKDVALIGAAELIVLQEERRYSERMAEIEREQAQDRRELEIAEQAKWDTYEHVSTTLIGRRLNPPLVPLHVNKLLSAAGLIGKNDSNEWVFTATGAAYGNPAFAKEGGKVPFAPWSKKVLAVLQEFCDRANESPAPLAR